MYKTFKELVLNASDEAYRYIEDCAVETEIALEDDEETRDLKELINLYCTGMLFLNKEKPSDHNGHDSTYARYFAGAEADGFESHFDEINNAIHLMHTAIPELRKEACEQYSLYVDDYLGMFRNYFYIDVPELHLTGKSPVPEWVEVAVNKYFEPIRDDVAITLRPSWQYSHIDCGLDYRYDRPEALKIAVSTFSKDTFKYIRTELMPKVMSELPLMVREHTSKKGGR